MGRRDGNNIMFVYNQKNQSKEQKQYSQFQQQEVWNISKTGLVFGTNLDWNESHIHNLSSLFLDHPEKFDMILQSIEQGL